MRKSTLLLPLLLLAATSSSRAAELKLPFEKYTLPNGLEVILSEDHHVPVVHVQVWYHVGSKDEQPGKTGFAHLFEHMMFQSTRDIAEDTWFKKLDAVGGFGINGTTNSERTNYFESVPANQLPLALWMESDRMGFLLDTLDEKALRNQQDVVRNERRQRYEMSPYGAMQKTLAEALYPAAHPYHHTTIGEHEDLARASVDDVRAFFRSHYAASNATLAVVGDIQPAEARRLVENYFGSLPAQPPPAHPAVAAPEAPVVQRVAMEANVQLPRFEYVWHAPVAFGPDDLELELAANMLGTGKTSRLYRKLVHETQIAQSVRVSHDGLEYGGVFSISVTLKPGHTIAEGRKLVDDELAHLASEPLTSVELERAKTRIEADFIRQLETAQGKASLLQLGNHYTHDPGRVASEMMRVRAASLAPIRAAMDKWLARPKLVVTVAPNKEAPLGGRVIADKPAVPSRAPASAAGAGPVAAAKSPLPVAAAKSPLPVAAATSAEATRSSADPWRSEPPRGGAAPEIKLPRPEQAKLKSGLRVLLVERHDVPIVEATLLVYAGTERTESKQAGLADLTAGMLSEGTTKHDALGLAAALDDLGARLSTSATQDAAYVSLNALAGKFEPSLDLFAEVVTSPAFAEKDLERLRLQRRTALLQQKDQPQVVFNNVASRAVYGDAHPYAFPLLGTEQTLQSFTRDDVARFFAAYYRPNNAVLIVVGDVTLPVLVKQLDARFAQWTAGTVERATPPGPPPALSRKVILVDEPQASQSVIGVAQVGVPRASADYVPLVVANYILGGSFSSRINMNLREKNGYSYGARSGFAFLRGPGLFSATGNVRGNVTKEALGELMKELASFRATRVTDEELAETKSSLIGKMPSRFETAAAVAGMLAELVRNALPLDWYATFARRVGAVKAADVQRVAKAHLTPDHAQIVVVGDRATVEPKLKELDLGVVELRGRFGEPLPPAL